MIIHLERLGSEGLVRKEKKPGRGRERPEFLYHAAHTSHSNMDSQWVVMLEFSKLKKSLQIRESGYCKPARDTCATQNCPLIKKPK